MRADVEKLMRCSKCGKKQCSLRACPPRAAGVTARRRNRRVGGRQTWDQYRWHTKSGQRGHSIVAERILLVDYENIQAVDLQQLADDVTVRFILGGKQGKLPSELAVQAHAMGERFAYVRILSVERNACDFVIAFYLGEFLRYNPKAECVILSKDKKGFDPLVRHLTAERGLNVRRVSAQKEAFPGDHAPALENNFERLTTLLKKEKAL